MTSAADERGRWRIVREGRLTPKDRELLHEARAASAHASAPFSRFQVGAALRVRGSTDIHVGWNVEDQSLARVLHAEQAALFAAFNAHRGLVEVLSIAIWGSGNTPPCGMCRQMIADTNTEARVLFPYDGGILVTKVGELLPLQFKLAPE
jgi:cytidine deaminase